MLVFHFIIKFVAFRKLNACIMSYFKKLTTKKINNNKYYASTFKMCAYENRYFVYCFNDSCEECDWFKVISTLSIKFNNIFFFT